MTGKPRPRGGPMNFGAGICCGVLPISRRLAVGEIAADHTCTGFTVRGSARTPFRCRWPRR